MLSKAIELMELELWRLEQLVVNLHKRKKFDRETYRKGEIKRLQRILNLMLIDKHIPVTREASNAK